MIDVNPRSQRTPKTCSSDGCEMKNRTLATLLFVAVFSCALVAVSPIAAATGPGAAEEAASEAIEEAEETTEEAAAAAPMEFAATQAHPNFAARVQTRIQRIKAHIARIRVTKRIDRMLPHDTIRYQVHLPKKRALIKQLRLRIHELRACTAPEQHGLC